jgi:hippurate hydrolase
MPAKMTSEDFSQYGLAGVPAVLLHIGAVDPAKLARLSQFMANFMYFGAVRVCK